MLRSWPAKRRKRNSSDHSTTAAGQGSCATVDIEDLHDSKCQLVCAPILPTQDTTDYPLSTTYNFHKELAEYSGQDFLFRKSTAAQHQVPSRSRGLLRTRDRLRDSSRIHFSSKIVPEVTGPDINSVPNDNPDTGRGRPKTVKQNSCLSNSGTYIQTEETTSQCLLDRVNPEYFEQDKYKWHSFMEQEPDTSGMMSIDPESAQDFTTLYMNKSSATQQETLQQSPLISGLDQMQQWTVPELDVASSSERSTFSSPDALAFATPTFETQESEQSLFELDAFEDLNRMFDWDGACASFVDEASPDCKDTDHSAPTAMQYNTSAFRTISMIREPYAKLQVDPAVYPLNNRFVESGMNVLDHCVTPTSSSSPGAEDEGPSTVCHNCGVTKTPLWRRTPDKRHSLCNACGLYLKQYKTMRPLVPRNRPQVAKKDEVCTNCEATKTSLWRKDENGLVICNACGLYFKLHGKARPVAMRKEKISRRKRYRNLSTERPANTEPILPCAPVTTCAPLQQQGQITVQA